MAWAGWAISLFLGLTLLSVWNTWQGDLMRAEWILEAERSRSAVARRAVELLARDKHRAYWALSVATKERNSTEPADKR